MTEFEGLPGWIRRICHLVLVASLAGCAGSGGSLPVAGPPSAAEPDRPFVGVGCEAHARTVHDAAGSAERQQMMELELYAYQGLVEEALTMRARAIRLVHELEQKDERGEPLSGRDLQVLSQGAVELLRQRAALLGASVAHECWLDDPIPADPAAARLQRTGIAISLSAALVLYDNYVSAISLYRHDAKLRRHLNRADDVGYVLQEGELNRIAASFASPANRVRVRRGLEWFEKHGADPRAISGDSDRYLTELIEQSPSRQMVRRARPVAYVGNMLNLFGLLTFDTLGELTDEGVNVASLIFGNAVGLVETRRGKLDGRPDVLDQAAATVKAGDILLEKTPFRLTDAFIPGYWGHVAVWIGSEVELRALGIWDHPLVRAHHKDIRAGRSVVEALRSGVEMNTLGHFLNIDDLGVLRQAAIGDEARAQVILQALRHVGKPYDFNFDVESTNRLVCSELVYHAYGHLEWPTVRRLGRVTISPDNIAARASGKGPLTVALLYHDGVEVPAPQEAAMAKLLEQPVVALAGH